MTIVSDPATNHWTPQLIWLAVRVFGPLTLTELVRMTELPEPTLRSHLRLHRDAYERTRAGTDGVSGWVYRVKGDIA